MSAETIVGLDEYQEQAMRTAGQVVPQRIVDLMVEFDDVAKDPRLGDEIEQAYEKLDLATLALGLAGEAGELADHIKKHVGHGHDLDPMYCLKEGGDCMWYIAAIMKRLGFKLSGVATANIGKLRARYPDGFSSEASINRADK